MATPRPSVHDCSTLVEILGWRAAHQANQRAYTFLADGETQEQSITYRELDAKARSIGALLERMNARGQRTLLVYPSGLDYICAFFGGLYAGAVNVPAYPPARHTANDRYLQRLEAIARDARPMVALTIASIRSVIEPLLPQLPELQSSTRFPTADLLSGTWRHAA
jgi:acyl-CoA synthetase (AMP-forming)/AMP-acid ligase II